MQLLFETLHKTQSDWPCWILKGGVGNDAMTNGLGPSRNFR